MVDRITAGDRILAFFASDGRLFFVIPMGSRTCIGTTDTQVSEPRAEVTLEDRQFVLDNANSLLDLERPLTPADVIAERCGVRPLATSESGGEADWVKLSRRHAVEVNRDQRHISIFGGKLTDCINVGDEVAASVAQLGVSLPYPDQVWYGEPNDSLKRQFLHEARLMKLDEMTPPSSSEPLTQRLWRRYGANAMEMLEAIRADRDSARLLIENAEYLRCEVEQAARREIITRLEDFLRRRSKIALVLSREEIVRAPGLARACEILFGEEAEVKLREYIDSQAPASQPLDLRRAQGA